MPQNLSDAIFITKGMRDIFSPKSQLRAMMQFELALTSTLEEHGLAQKGSSDSLAAFGDAAFVDCDALQGESVAAGNIAIPFLRQLTASLAGTNQTATRSLHLGATSQDLLDTALVLQLREAFQSIADKIARLEIALMKQIRVHADTIMPGRTWLQPGPPTTFGLKLAGSLAALRRSSSRIEAVKTRALVLQFGGAVGTLSALEEKGATVARALAHRLKLPEPSVPWHSQRDNIAEVCASLAILMGTLGKLAGDIALLMQAEVSEVSEGAREGKGGSSTMPHKRNPVSCAAILAATHRAPGLASTMFSSMIQEHERGLGSWQAEWNVLPELFCLTDGALAHAIDLIENLVVHPHRMRANIDAMRGLPLSEAISVALARKVGRPQANELLRRAMESASAQDSNLAGVLKSMPEVRAHLNEEQIDSLLDPERYLGSARRFIRQVLGDADAKEQEPIHG